MQVVINLQYLGMELSWATADKTGVNKAPMIASSQIKNKLL